MLSDRDWSCFTHLTFDCYGTLVDWESGILAAVHPVLTRHRIEAEPGKILRLYADLEAEAEKGAFRPYRQVLREVMAGLGARLGFHPTDADLEALPASLPGWPPFPDTVESLRRLQSRYRLAILSNVDDDLFAGTNERLGVTFDAVVTAQQVGSYKPDRRNFEAVLERIGASPSRVLHVAQSLYHDHVPAKALGFRTVWINRPTCLPGTGVALPAEVRPDLELPDLRSLVHAAGL